MMAITGIELTHIVEEYQAQGYNAIRVVEGCNETREIRGNPTDDDWQGELIAEFHHGPRQADFSQYEWIQVF